MANNAKPSIPANSKLRGELLKLLNTKIPTPRYLLDTPEMYLLETKPDALPIQVERMEMIARTQKKDTSLNDMANEEAFFGETHHATLANEISIREALQLIAHQDMDIRHIFASYESYRRAREQYPKAYESYICANSDHSAFMDFDVLLSTLDCIAQTGMLPTGVGDEDIPGILRRSLNVLRYIEKKAESSSPENKPNMDFITSLTETPDKWVFRTILNGGKNAPEWVPHAMRQRLRQGQVDDEDLKAELTALATKHWKPSAEDYREGSECDTVRRAIDAAESKGFLQLVESAIEHLENVCKETGIATYGQDDFELD